MAILQSDTRTVVGPEVLKDGVGLPKEKLHQVARVHKELVEHAGILWVVLEAVGCFRGEPTCCRSSCH
eukprot:2673076-Prorocentrum_lima.AAC.1